MHKLKSDRDGFAGIYEIEGHRFEVQKFYQKNVGARWKFVGKWFGDRTFYNYADTKAQVAEWFNMGGQKVA